MNVNKSIDNQPKYINPYLGGVLLGLLVLVTVFITGRGLGASGAIKSTVVTTANTFAPENTKENSYMGQFISDDHSPMYTWLVFRIAGNFPRWIAFRNHFWQGEKIQGMNTVPKITSRKRLIFALSGRRTFWRRKSVWPRMYKWSRIKW